MKTRRIARDYCKKQTRIMSDQTSQLSCYWQHFAKYQPLIRKLVSRDLKVKYRRSSLGYVRSILNPLLMMALQTVIFRFMFRGNTPNYPRYLICGTTLLFVSHDSNSVRRLCKRAIWLDHGNKRADGPSDEVCNEYEEAMRAGEK